ncbi:hypothetical protein RF11_08995 [Thelohanellus kitauei]|uniref:EGF-like domain-containing protein n=1 Tax=Thelohanellus kitauei TaxID=669202 RepID=A0A0C2IBW2_THEKT|nr:hypothetical protein RF11_08995 [Thelohanellus kitauei]
MKINAFIKRANIRKPFNHFIDMIPVRCYSWIPLFFLYLNTENTVYADKQETSHSKFDKNSDKYRRAIVTVRGSSNTSQKFSYSIKCDINESLVFSSDVDDNVGDFVEEQTIKDSQSSYEIVFKENSIVEFFVYISEFSHEPLMIQFWSPLFVIPNEKWTYSRTVKGYTVNFEVAFKCNGYTGYNCQFEFIDNEHFTTDFFTGELRCLNVCTIANDNPCDNATCYNHGQCYEKSDASKYCVCDEPWAGDFCEFNRCHIDEDDFMFGE